MSYGLKKQISKLNPKMGFWRAKHGLSKHGNLKTKLVSCFGKRKNRMGEEEEKKKIEEPRSSKPRYGTLDFWYGINLGYEF